MQNINLGEIHQPSLRIKPSMNGSLITKTNEEVHLGRVVHSDSVQVQMMLVVNRIFSIPRKEIEKEEGETKSLMYEGLLNSLSEEEKEALLSYLLNAHLENTQPPSNTNL